MGAPYALSSDLVSAWPAKSLEVAQYIDGQVPLIAMTQNAQTGTTYTLAATDFTKLVTLSNASPVTVTVPLESSVAWVAGTQLRLMNLGAGLVTVAGAVGVTINGSPLTLAQYKGGTLTKTGTNTWTFVGSPSAPGMDLITPTSVAGSGVTLSGAVVSFSTATTISVNGVFTSAYENYMIMASWVATTGLPEIGVRMRAAGSDASGANYLSIRLSVETGVGGARTTGATSGTISYGAADGTTSTSFMYAPALAAYTSFTTQGGYQTAGSGGLTNFWNVHQLSTAYDGFSAIPASSNVTGKLRVYGIRTS